MCSASVMHRRPLRTSVTVVVFVVPCGICRSLGVMCSNSRRLRACWVLASVVVALRAGIGRFAGHPVWTTHQNPRQPGIRKRRRGRAIQVRQSSATWRRLCPASRSSSSEARDLSGNGKDHCPVINHGKGSTAIPAGQCQRGVPYARRGRAHAAPAAPDRRPGLRL